MLVRLMIYLFIFCSTISGFVRCEDEFQRYDGWYNNMNHVNYGAAESNLIHIAGTAYSDGILVPSGKHRPPPGELSVELLRGKDGLEPQRNLTAFFAFFGQAVSGEIVATIASGNIACPAEMMPLDIYSTDCSAPVGQINDSCKQTSRKMPFFRAAYDHETGLHYNNPRRPVNFASSWIDGSFVYSHMTPWADSLRQFQKGRLLSDNSTRNPTRVPILNPPPPAEHPSLLTPERLFCK